MKENFSEMTKRPKPTIGGQRKWGIVGIFFILIMLICFVFGISFAPKQVEPKPFTAFGQNASASKKMETTITLNYAFTPDMKFSVYHIGNEKMTNIDIQPSCYTINVKNTQTIITFKNLIKGEKYIFVKEPYDSKFPEVPIP